MRVHFDTSATPIGRVRFAVREDHGPSLCLFGFSDGWEELVRYLRTRFEDPDLVRGGAPREFHRAIEAYFEGECRALESLPVDPGGTPFQAKVWAALRKIPVGKTISYGELARRIGRPGASRAVGAANGANPIALVIPCHRVIASDGTLGGYGGGLPRKEWLLVHEGAIQPRLV